jgi:hypothetical protein
MFRDLARVFDSLTGGSEERDLNPGLDIVARPIPYEQGPDRETLNRLVDETVASPASFVVCLLKTICPFR